MGDRMTPERPVAERGADLRLARLHVRGGAYALARAELEALAGSDGLDRDGILDLAEVRWRTGDLRRRRSSPPRRGSRTAPTAAPRARSPTSSAPKLPPLAGRWRSPGPTWRRRLPGWATGPRSTRSSRASRHGRPGRGSRRHHLRRPPRLRNRRPGLPVSGAALVGGATAGQPLAQAAGVAPAAAAARSGGGRARGRRPRARGRAPGPLPARRPRRRRGRARRARRGRSPGRPTPPPSPSSVARPCGRPGATRSRGSPTLSAESLALTPAEAGTPRSPQ